MQIIDEFGRRCEFAAKDVLLIAERMIDIDGFPGDTVDPAKCDVTIALVDKAITLTAAQSYEQVVQNFAEEVSGWS